jgi:hypothetical protein
MEPFNPLDKKNLAISIAQALLTQSLDPLPPKKTIRGCGHIRTVLYWYS